MTMDHPYKHVRQGLLAPDPGSHGREVLENELKPGQEQVSARLESMIDIALDSEQRVSRMSAEL